MFVAQTVLACFPGISNISVTAVLELNAWYQEQVPDQKRCVSATWQQNNAVTLSDAHIHINPNSL